MKAKKTHAVRAQLAEGGHKAQVEIIDSGDGIATHDLAHIFEAFYRSQKSRARDGSGAGLAIAHGIVEGHSGTIGVASESGTGSRFWFTLPR